MTLVACKVASSAILSKRSAALASVAKEKRRWGQPGSRVQKPAEPPRPVLGRSQVGDRERAGEGWDDSSWRCGLARPARTGLVRRDAIVNRGSDQALRRTGVSSLCERPVLGVVSARSSSCTFGHFHTGTDRCGRDRCGDAEVSGSHRRDRDRRSPGRSQARSRAFPRCCSCEHDGFSTR